MEASGVCFCGVESAIQLLVHPFALAAAEIMVLSRQTVEFYEFYDYIFAYFTRLRCYAKGLQLIAPLFDHHARVTPGPKQTDVIHLLAR